MIPVNAMPPITPHTIALVLEVLTQCVDLDIIIERRLRNEVGAGRIKSPEGPGELERLIVAPGPVLGLS